MAPPLIIPTKFTAIDSFTPVFNKMTAAGTAFTSRMSAGFNTVAIAERKVRRGLDGIKSRLGSIGRLGVGIGGLTILTAVGSANIELDNSIQSLQAITGLKGQEFVDFRKEIDRVSNSQKIFSADTAKAFELVGSAKPELLASADALGEVTEAALILGKAGKLEVTDSVKSLTVSMNQFGAGANRASEFVDILATAQQKGSGTIQYLSEAMVNAGGTSKAFGNSFADTVAILEGFAKAGVPASEAGTMLSGILAKLSTTSNAAFNPQFTKATDIINNLSKANLSYNDLLAMTDVRGAKWLTTIINQNEIVQELTGNLYEVGNAQAQADVQTESLGIKIKELTDSFKNQVTSTDESNIGMSIFKGLLTIVTDNMGLLIGAIGTAIGAYISMKVILFVVRAATIAYNLALGINTALQKGNVFALRGSQAAMIGYKIATVAYTAVQWVANAALWAFPLTWIIGGLVAVGAAVAGLIIYWEELTEWVKTSDNWFASFIRDTVYPIIDVFNAVGLAIDLLGDKFAEMRAWLLTSDDGFAEFTRSYMDSIGAITDSLSSLFSMFGDGSDLNANLDVNQSGVTNPDAAIEQARIQREESVTTNRQTNEFIFRTAEGLEIEQVGASNDIPIKLTSTM